MDVYLLDRIALTHNRLFDSRFKEVKFEPGRALFILLNHYLTSIWPVYFLADA
jgi:hypothetical protein